MEFGRVSETMFFLPLLLSCFAAFVAGQSERDIDSTELSHVKEILSDWGAVDHKIFLSLLKTRCRRLFELYWRAISTHSSHLLGLQFHFYGNPYVLRWLCRRTVRGPG
jgi:hypothetical protein